VEEEAEDDTSRCAVRCSVLQGVAACCSVLQCSIFSRHEHEIHRALLPGHRPFFAD